MYIRQFLTVASNSRAEERKFSWNQYEKKKTYSSFKNMFSEKKPQVAFSFLFLS